MIDYLKGLFRKIPEFDTDSKVRNGLWEGIKCISDKDILLDLNVEIHDKVEGFFKTKGRFEARLNAWLSSLGVALSVVIALTLYLIKEKSLSFFWPIYIYAIGLILLFFSFIIFLNSQKLKRVYSELKEVSYFDFGNSDNHARYLKMKIYIMAYDSAKNNYYLELMKRKCLAIPSLIILGFLITVLMSGIILAVVPNKRSDETKILKNISNELSLINNSLHMIDRHNDLEKLSDSISTRLDSLNETSKNLIQKLGEN